MADMTRNARRVVLIGNCQAQAMANLYRRFVAERTGDIVEHVASYQDMTPQARHSIEQADLIVEQLFDLKQQTEASNLAKSTPRVFLPMVTAAFLWPFAGQAHPKNVELPWLAAGPYGGEASDSYLNRLILVEKSPQEAVELYASLAVNSRMNLDRLFELVMDRQQSRDEASGYDIANVIKSYFRTEQVFLSPYHPNLRVALSLATQFFQKVGATQSDIDRMHNCIRVTPFPKTELPLHPDVCRHFKLDFVKPDRRYLFMNEGRFTFRDYALRYMKLEWNPDLEEGLSLMHAGKREAARDKLITGLAVSPNSAVGQHALGHILSQAGDNEGAEKAMRRAVEIEPDHGPYHASLGALLRKTGAVAEAEVALLTAIMLDPSDMHHYVLMAHMLRHRGEFAESRSMILQALEFEPYSAFLHMEYSHAQESIGDLEGALAAQSRAVELAPDETKYAPRLADLRRRLGLPPLPPPVKRPAPAAAAPPVPAATITENTDAAASNDPQMLLERAQRLFAQNDLTAAEAAIRGAIGLNSSVYFYHVLLSDILARRGDRTNAAKEARLAFELAPDSAHALGHLAHVTQLGGNVADAIAMYREAVAMEPGNAHLRGQLRELEQRAAQA